MDEFLGILVALLAASFMLGALVTLGFVVLIVVPLYCLVSLLVDLGRWVKRKAEHSKPKV